MLWKSLAFADSESDDNDMPSKRRPRTSPRINELLLKSREAALAAVQIFNTPQITFKSEIFIVLMNVAWTYLLHAYYQKRGIDYRHWTKIGGKTRLQRTKRGAIRYWELEKCLESKVVPIDRDSSNNLKFLIGIRHEIEHQMTRRIDQTLSAKFQACCLNYNTYIKKLFGKRTGIDRHLALTLQFSSITPDQRKSLAKYAADLPAHIKTFIDGFEGALSSDEYNSPKFAYRVLFVAKTANQRGQADEVIEFVKSDSPLAATLNANYVVTKETEKPKLLASRIVKMMHQEGFPRFKIHHHTELWQSMDAKNPNKNYGVLLDNAWYWYERWVEQVREFCRENRKRFQ